MNKNYVMLSLLLTLSANAQFGALDVTLDPGSGADNVVQALAVQPDQKIIIGGDFLNYGGVAKKRLTRINYDGTTDPSFNIGAGANKLITGIRIQPDAKIIVTGRFSIFNNTSKKRIVRLNNNGSIDATFNTGYGANDDIEACLLLPDGKIIVGGIFTSFNWMARSGIARLNADGTLDTSFDFGNEPLEVTDVKLLPDGKYLVNGINKLMRLNHDGTKDITFNSGTGTDYPIQSTCVQADGRILVGGYFTIYDGFPISRFLRLTADGVIDTEFNSGTGADYGVVSISEQPDSQILISGLFSTYNGALREKVARLHPDGTLDNSFNPYLGPNNIVLHHVQQPDGRILIAGDFTEYNGVQRNKIARIDAFSFLSTGNNAAAAKFVVYPNPAKDIISVELPGNQPLISAKIFDLAGKLVGASDFSGNQINIGMLSPGMYLLSATTETGSVNTRIIKK